MLLAIGALELLVGVWLVLIESEMEKYLARALLATRPFVTFGAMPKVIK
jgi:hypothetical protein